MGDKPHKRLEAWKRALELVTDVYKLTGAFPAHERYALVDQMRRAAVSIPCNVAEGAARQTKKEFAQFLHVARGSLSELDTQLEIAGRLGYMPAEGQRSLQSSCEAVDRLLNGLVRSLRPRAL
ncbi:MAG: four helix bundle protein [Nitrospiraceae bacterium]